MTAQSLIVWEPGEALQTRVVPHVRRHVGRITTVRRLPAVQRALAASPAAILLAELGPETVGPMLELLFRLPHEAPQVRAIVAAQRGWEAYEELVRELGAVDFAPSPRSLERLAETIAALASRAPQTALTLEQAHWEQLPWATSSRDFS